MVDLLGRFKDVLATATDPDAKAGIALIVALTCPDQDTGELARALAALQQNRAGVDSVSAHAQAAG